MILNIFFSNSIEACAVSLCLYLLRVSVGDGEWDFKLYLWMMIIPHTSTLAKKKKNVSAERAEALILTNKSNVNTL